MDNVLKTGEKLIAKNKDYTFLEVSVCLEEVLMMPMICI